MFDSENCELCDNPIGDIKRREDNLMVCDGCDDAFPYKEEEK